MNGNLRNMTSLYLRSGNEMLLLYRIGSKVIADSFTASAGGHFEKEELNNARACVLRELQEETGLCEEDIRNLSLRYVTLRLKNGEIRQNYYFFADVADRSKAMTSTEGRLKWFQMEELPDVMSEMPFTARYVVKHYLEIGKKTDVLYAGAATESGVVFTEMKEF
ncbi:MAG: NUDIX domain-containing protein [bacterium]|nr:NUDIX domain-containing protein [bacterium]